MLMVLGSAMGAALITSGTALAEPDCVVHDHVDPIGGPGSNWRLQIDASCDDKSFVFGTTWDYGFWAETQGGGPALKHFTGNGTPIQQHVKFRGPAAHVTVEAPAGYGRYCYSARIVFESPTIYEAPKREYSTGTICKDT